MRKKYKVVFMGTPEFAVPALRSLAKKSAFEVVAVVTQPDKRAGRKGELRSPAVKGAAQDLGLPLLQPERIKTKEFVSALRALEPDVIVVAAYGKILPKSILEIPAHGAVNVHGSLLPKYRGASPITQAIIDREKETGATIMVMSEEMDEGPVLGFSEAVTIGPKDTTESLLHKVAEVGARALVEILPQYLGGKIKPKAQDHKKASYVKLITKIDGKIDWTEDENIIERKVRAYQPWPEAYTTWNGKMIKILDAQVIDVENIKGLVAKINKKLFIGKLQINLLQLEGKKPFSGEAFLAGHPQIIGESVL
jgi:methionyl-tRNA formyltransferase